MTNTASLIQCKRTGKRFLPPMGDRVAGILASPLCRTDFKALTVETSDEDKNGTTGNSARVKLSPSSLLTWGDTSFWLLSDQGPPSIKSPLNDSGMHFSSMDQWVLADLDLDYLSDSLSATFSPKLEASRPHREKRVGATSRRFSKTGTNANQTIEFPLLSETESLHRKRKRRDSQVGGANGLAVADVRIIFRALQANLHPPTGLEFRIVQGTKGQKISPPSYQFENGLYILMKPLKRRRRGLTDTEKPTIPSQLLGVVMVDTPPLDCPWSISGPQFSKPTDVQKRYCYSSGDESYSSTTGATLWTVYDQEGNEDFDYRLLHVYHSTKRGFNRGSDTNAVCKSCK